MKKCLFVTLSFLLLASCSVKTNEEKAREIIEPEVKSSLIIPESYEFAQLQPVSYTHLTLPTILLV